jgi:dTDP-4-dehydrorhamnose 3,5-epimerase
MVSEKKLLLEPLELEGSFLITPVCHVDDRGYFMESYNKADLESTLGAFEFVQDNESKSNKDVLRGFHFQTGEFAQTKLVRVISGRVRDYIIDLRSSSKTFGKILSFELTGENKKQLLVPKGFGHAFLTLEDETVFSYKVDNYYNQRSDSGISFFSKSLEFERYINKNKAALSKKDEKLFEFDKSQKYF